MIYGRTPGGIMFDADVPAPPIVFRPAPTDALIATGPCPGDISFTCTGHGIEVCDPRSADFDTVILCGACREHLVTLLVCEQAHGSWV